MAKPFETIPVLPRRLALWGAAIIALSVTMAGCAGFRREQRAQWRNDAEVSCLKSGRVKENAYVKISKAIDGPGVCGANYPLKVSAVASEVSPQYAQAGNLILTSGNLMLTSITPTATLSCPMVASVDDWLAQDVQAAAQTWFNQPVIELITFGSFSCRPMNHRAGAQLSEHSFANAIDAKAFKLADGRVVSVAKGWRGPEDEQGFLRETLFGACNRFSTVLGPGSDALHYDHFHLDMARHGQNGQRRICKPRVEMPAPPVQQPPQYGLQPMADAAPVMKPGSYIPPSAVGQAGLRPPQDMDQAAVAGMSARLPAARPAQRPMPLIVPNTDLQQTGNPEVELEDLSNEQNFDGKYFDVTGSIRDPNEPQRVIQRPGPPKQRARKTVTAPAFDPAAR